MRTIQDIINYRNAKYPPTDFRERAISDSGPRFKITVYQRLTGRIIWTQPWWMPYWIAKRVAPNKL